MLELEIKEQFYCLKRDICEIRAKLGIVQEGNDTTGLGSSESGVVSTIQGGGPPEVKIHPDEENTPTPP
jgi:hypothetical protein